MSTSPDPLAADFDGASLAPINDAPQHRPRPLPLFLSMLRSETAGEPERMAAALRGLRTYQAAARAERPAPPRPVTEARRAKLLDFGGSGRPVVFVPSLINGPDVLDLLPELSLMRWLEGQGVRPYLVDWGTPSGDERRLSIAGHVETLLLPLLRGMTPDFALAGYCLGGTMALAAAAHCRPAGLALIAAPWRFAGFPDTARTGLADLYRQARPTAEAIGLLPVEVLQTGFWRLDPRRTVDKFVAFGAGTRDPRATRLFVALEDWANGGPPLALAAGTELVDDLFGADVTGRGAWRVGGRAIDPAALGCPVLDIVSTSDRIVPAASAAGIGTTMKLSLGHVGMIVGGRARDMLWQPLVSWLRDPHIG